MCYDSLGGRSVGAREKGDLRGREVPGIVSLWEYRVRARFHTFGIAAGRQAGRLWLAKQMGQPLRGGDGRA